MKSIIFCHSTTHWDRKQRKAIATSKYLGILSRKEGFAQSNNETTQSKKATIPEIGALPNMATQFFFTSRRKKSSRS